MTYILYKTTNLANGKYYIGVSNGNNPNYRGSGVVLKQAIKEYGIKNFKREILETFDSESEAFAREAEIVNGDFVNDRQTYNIKIGGKGGTGHQKTKSHKEKIKQSILKKYKANGGKGNPSAGRKPAMDRNLLIECVKNNGFTNAAKILNLTFHQCRDRYYRALKQTPL